MTEQEPDEPYSEGHPVLWGVLALVGVAALVGVVLGGGAMVASRALGLSDDSAATDQSSQQETLNVPRPSETDKSTDPSITLPPGPSEPTSSFTRAPEPEFPISLESAQTAVSPMQEIDLNGTYPGGDGAILRVQQWQSGAWDDFPVTAPVNGGAFYTYIQASMIGPNRFRMIDTDSGDVSNEIRVEIG